MRSGSPSWPRRRPAARRRSAATGRAPRGRPRRASRPTSAHARCHSRRARARRTSSRATAASRASRSRGSGTGGCRSCCFLRSSRLGLSQPRDLLAGDRLGHVLQVSVGDERDSLHALLQLRSEGRDLARILEHRVARVEDAGEQVLAEVSRERVGAASSRSRSRSRPPGAARGRDRGARSRRRT